MVVWMIEPSGKRGLSQYTHNLANALAARGIDVLLVTSVGFETKELPRRYRAMEVFSHLFPRPLRVIRLLAAALRQKPDLVHVQGAIHPALYLALWLLLRPLLNRPWVYTAHEIRPIKWKRINEWAFPRLLRRASHVIVHARANQEYLIAHFRFPRARSSIISVGSNTAFLAVADASRTTPSSRKVVLFFGIISPRKGLMSLIEAFPQIRQSINDAFLLIVGQPFENVGPYQERIRALGLADASQLRLGYVPLSDIPEVFAQASVVVLPYLDSSQSGVVLSAYAFGKPVVASDVGGIGELVEDGQTGFLCPPGQSGFLADAVTRILKDDDLRAEMGRRAADLVRTTHSWEGIGARTASVYTELLSVGGTQSGANQ